MAGGKESARQRMINIMYLVLLAMLALNVSDTILNAFKNINDSLETSKNNVNNSVDQLFSAFENTKLKEEPARAKPLYESAKQARASAEDLNTYIENLKKEFIKEGNGYDETTGDLVERANLDIAPGYMINKGKGLELKNKINQTREKLISLLDPKDRATISFSLEARDPAKAVEGKKSWEEINFGEGTPLTAAMTILTKLQSDVKNAESDVVKRIFGKMDIAVVNLDQFAAVAVAPTSYVIQGEPYTAEVFLTAYDSKLNPSVSVNGSALQVKDGKGVYTVGTSSEGIHTWVGTVRVKQTDGTIKEYKTPTQTYQVARPSAVVSPDQMLVFYVGVDNPVSVSAPGIPKDKIRISLSRGSSTGSDGKYVVKLTSADIGQTTAVTVSAEINGKMQSFGSSNFRIKRIPDPKAKFGGKSGGTVSPVALKAQTALFASLEDFAFNARFAVTSFNMVIVKPRSDAQTFRTNGQNLSPEMRNAMNGLTPGSRVFFENIVAVGPDGVSRPIDGIAFVAN